MTDDNSLPPRFEEFLKDDSRLAAFLARATLRDRRSLAALAEPDAALLSEGALRLNAKAPADLLDAEKDLASEFQGFRPDPLWVAWFSVRHGRRIREAFQTWAKETMMAEPPRDNAGSQNLVNAPFTKKGSGGLNKAPLKTSQHQKAVRARPPAKIMGFKKNK